MRRGGAQRSGQRRRQRALGLAGAAAIDDQRAGAVADSKASVEAQPPLSARGGGGGAASITSTLAFA